jgi:hypothetical protein
MNDSELDKILKAAKTPERSDEFWAQFPRHVTSRLHWKPAAREGQSRHWLPRLAWSLTALAACVLIGFFVGHWRGRSDALAENGLLQNEKVIKEMLAMFPNRVRAVVQDDHGLHLVLSDKDDVPASTPLWVKVCDGKNCSATVTFSGQQIQVGHQDVTVLADPQGKIILAGDSFLWSNGHPMLAGNDKLKIEAKALGPLVL